MLSDSAAAATAMNAKTRQAATPFSSPTPPPSFAAAMPRQQTRHAMLTARCRCPRHAVYPVMMRHDACVMKEMRHPILSPTSRTITAQQRRDTKMHECAAP